ncbi:MAG: hypothetical protein ABIJ16_13450 [Bacteroidota bacterium]
MTWYQWLAIISLAYCGLICVYHFIRLIKLGKPVDFSEKTGNTGSGIRYSYTGAMKPSAKESAYLNLPTYAAGLVFHLGTFFAIALFFFFLFNMIFPLWFEWIAALCLGISGICGLAILLKRIFSKELRSFSNPDDYISNMLVTGFQLATAIVLFVPVFVIPYFLIAASLLIYLPAGKLKHTVYFFAARYHLGYFFGWRNVWPPKKV